MLSKWWREKAKRKLLKWLNKVVPELASGIAGSLNDRIDALQESGELDKMAEAHLRTLLPDGAIESIAIQAFKNYGAEILDRIIDDAQAKFLTEQAIEELAEDLVDRI